MDKIEYWKNKFDEEFKIVNGKLELDNLAIFGKLDLDGCESLVSLPDDLTVFGFISLEGCKSLEHIGKNIIFTSLYFDEYCINIFYQEENIKLTKGRINLNVYIPESMKRKFIGKRIIDLINDTRIYGTEYADAIIISSDYNSSFIFQIQGQ